MPVEDKLIFLFSRVTLNETEVIQEGKLLRAGLDWDYILKKSQREDVSALIYHHLNKSRVSCYIPRHILGHLEGVYYGNSTRNTVILEEAKEILGALNREDVRTIVLKGIFLAESIYKNIALRPMTDIDILIKKKDLAKADEVLNSSGYISPPNYRDFLENSSLTPINTLTYKGGNSINFPVHLHWHLINATWPLDFLVSKMDMERIWSWAEPAKVGGIDTLTLAPHHLLIYLAQHSFTHSFDRSVLLSDILEILRCYEDRLNWDLVIEDAERFGLSRVLYYSLSFASKVLNFEIPELEKLKLAMFGFFEEMVSFCASKGIRWRGLSYIVYLFMRKGFLGKSRFIGKTILPSPNVMAHNLSLPVSEITASHYYQRLFRHSLKI